MNAQGKLSNKHPIVFFQHIANTFPLRLNTLGLLYKYGGSTTVETKKIGISVMWKVRKYGSGIYMRIPIDDALAFDIRPGDKLRLKLESVVKLSEAEEVKT